jgi:tellurite methyltransferase
MTNRSIEFFDKQFERQLRERHFYLNPFETAILPFLSGDVLDLGCGLGNLTIAAAKGGCRVTALDASPTAVQCLRLRAEEENLPLTTRETDLQDLAIEGEFDCVVAIGLLMFFPEHVAQKALAKIRGLVRPEGMAAVNVLIRGTTFMNMFDPAAYYLFNEAELLEAFIGWGIEYAKIERFPAPNDTVKVFSTVVARRPA